MKPALEGGRPVRDTLLPYGHQLLDEEDLQAVTRVLRGDWLTTGPTVEEFEHALARLVGAKFAVAVSSGTAALHIAMLAAGLQAGDEVVTTPLTFAATANSIFYAGARPVFADIDGETMNLSPRAAEAQISSRTRAIAPVDYAGRACELPELLALARKHNCLLIEDAAHALGATFQGQPVGSIAELTTFSFHPVKHITTGEGGMVTTDNEAIAARLLRLRNHGLERGVRPGEPWFYEMRELGFNYRLTDFQCALGLSQLKKLAGWLARRRQIVQSYDEKLRAWPLRLPPPDRESAWHLYVVRLKLDRLRVGREVIFQALRAENIGVQVHYIPVYYHPLYRRLGYGPGLCPRAEAAYEEMLTLPLWAGMTDRDVANVVEAVGKVMDYYAA